MEPRLRNLLKQGERAARLGKLQAAESVYRQALADYPDSAEAWLGLSRVAPTKAERDAAQRRALTLDPSLSTELENAERPITAPSDFESASSQLDAALQESQSWLQQATVEQSETARPVATPLPAEQAVVDAGDKALSEISTCYYHPKRETALQCNRCSKPICTSCAHSTPVGYRCKDCIKEQQETFYTALWYDHITATAVTIPLAAIASAIIPSIGWLTIFIAPFAGTLIAELVRLVTGRRRGRWLPLVVSASIVVGTAPALLGGLIGFALYSFYVGSILWQVVYLALAISSAYYRLK